MCSKLEALQGDCRTSHHADAGKAEANGRYLSSTDYTGTLDGRCLVTNANADSSKVFTVIRDASVAPRQREASFQAGAARSPEGHAGHVLDWIGSNELPSNMFLVDAGTCTF